MDHSIVQSQCRAGSGVAGGYSGWEAGVAQNLRKSAMLEAVATLRSELATAAGKVQVEPGAGGPEGADVDDQYVAGGRPLGPPRRHVLWGHTR